MATSHPPIPPQMPVFDALNYLSFLAGQTENIVRHPGLQHRLCAIRFVSAAAATLDIVSSGRFEFGVGASWLREEWDAVGLDFRTRGSRVGRSSGDLPCAVDRADRRPSRQVLRLRRGDVRA